MNRFRHRARLALVVVAVAVLVTGTASTQRVRGRRLALAATLPATVGTWNAVLVQMERSADLRVVQVDDDLLVPGRRFERLQQFHRDVPIWGADVVRETDGPNTKSIFGSVYQDVEVDVVPRLNGEQAKESAGHQLDFVQAAADAALFVLPRDDGTYALTWRVEYFTGTSLPVVFVNAATGAIEWQYDNLQRQTPALGQGTGTYGDLKKIAAASSGGTYYTYDSHFRPTLIATYDMRGDLAHEQAIESRRAVIGWSDLASDADNNWTDPAVVDTHTYLGYAYDYFYKRFGRKGLDGIDRRPVQALVHAVRRQDFDVKTIGTTGSYYLNAWFCPRCSSDNTDTFMFGEGLPANWTSGGQSVNYFSASLDIIVHEYTHAITSYTSNLAYINESGALNEAFSDIMGVSAEFMFQPAGNGVLKADWLQGEDTMRAKLPGAKDGGRSLSDPQSLGHPDHYSKRYTGTGDGGGVHTNSTIPSHAFYLAVVGGTNRTSGLAVQGVGDKNREQIEQAFYRAFTTLPSRATFYDARLKTIDSARTLQGAGSLAEQAITQAWNAVGVVSPPSGFATQDYDDRRPATSRGGRR